MTDIFYVSAIVATRLGATDIETRVSTGSHLCRRKFSRRSLQRRAHELPVTSRTLPLSYFPVPSCTLEDIRREDGRMEHPSDGKIISRVVQKTAP